MRVSTVAVAVGHALRMSSRQMGSVHFRTRFLAGSMAGPRKAPITPNQFRELVKIPCGISDGRVCGR
jgi:hypothetical protein